MSVNNVTVTTGSQAAWQYNQVHRRGVNYSNPALRQTYGTISSVSVPSNNLRGGPIGEHGQLGRTPRRRGPAIEEGAARHEGCEEA